MINVQLGSETTHSDATLKRVGFIMLIRTTRTSLHVYAKSAYDNLNSC